MPIKIRFDARVFEAETTLRTLITCIMESKSRLLACMYQNFVSNKKGKSTIPETIVRPEKNRCLSIGDHPLVLWTNGFFGPMAHFHSEPKGLICGGIKHRFLCPI